jgi:hypothetical protein
MNTTNENRESVYLRSIAAVKEPPALRPSSGDEHVECYRGHLFCEAVRMAMITAQKKKKKIRKYSECIIR